KEAATVAEPGVVNAELVSVVPERERRFEVARQRLELREMRLPLFGREGIDADVLCGAVVTVAQHALRKRGGLDRIVERCPELEDAWIGNVRGADRHSGGGRSGLRAAQRHLARERRPHLGREPE